MEDFIIATPDQDAGLSNRLKCFVSVQRLANLTSRKPLFYWKKTFSCGADFNELFENNLQIISDREFENIKTSKDSITYKSYPEKLDKAKKYILFDSWRFIVLPGEVRKGFAKVFPNDKGDCIDLEFERTPKKLQKQFLFFIKRLYPNKEISERVKKFIDEHNDFDNVVGLHVRRNEFTLNSRASVSSDEKFFSRMNKIIESNSKTKFFLATDAKATEQKFLEKFGDKIITFPKKSTDRNNPLAVQEALIELLLLSKTKHLLGTYLSTFTEMAWWFGGCKAKVEVIGYKGQPNTGPVKEGFTSKLKKPISLVVQSLRRNSELFRQFLRLIGKWG